MAANPSRTDAETATQSTQAFATSLQLSSDDEARVLDILSASPALTVDDASTAKQTHPSMVHAGCQISRLIFGENCLLDDSTIEQAVSVSWSQTCWQSPRCVIQPTTSLQVSQALKIITFLRIPFSIRSGGHSPNPGHSGLESGFLVDLSKLNSMTISEDRKTFSVGPGVRWGQVYEFLDPYDVTAVGGRIPHVGVGGLLLGGGLSFWTGEYGLATDNVASFEVVLADGSILNANARERSDLFWALKGGGPNFGIVTRFDVHTIPVKNIWFQLNIHSLEQAPLLLEAYAAWQQSPDNKGSVAMIISQTSITLGLIYSQPTEKPETFAPFYDITPLKTVVPPNISTVKALSKMTGALAPAAPRHDYRAASSKIDAELYQSVYAAWKAEATKVHETTGATSTFVLSHIPKNVIDIGNANGGNAMGLEPIPQQWWTTLIDWEHAKDDEAARGIAIATTAKWKELGMASGSYLPFIYMNDASRDQDPLGSYPAANVERLREVAAKYDNLGVFQMLQNDGFLLSKVGG
ncbi:FAD-binding domain-containing protein [Decorospora gaudefroyi]|uniref:FAD-binding domain-containing protein n=1 Tax=Decorospora gaudefroyi TaxID=184978 RepID=A0A6A5KBT5_9PLEO|nr:FAD-binding domain-containing protein [Decorospora gaudefroyi]